MSKVKISDISSFVTSGSRGWAYYYSDAGALFLRMTNLPKNGIKLLLNDNKYVQLPENSNEGKRTAVKDGDILISITAELGKIGFIESLPNSEAYVNQHVCLVRPIQNKVNPKFLAYYLSSQPQRNLLNRLNDSGAKSGLNLSTISKFPVHLPGKKTQEFVVETLEQWDTAIEKTEALIAAKERRFEWLVTRFFSPNNELTSSWKRHKIGEFVKRRKEKSPPTKDMPLYSLTIENGVTAKTDRYNREFLVKDKGSKIYKIVYPKDIVFNPANLRWGAIARSEALHKVVLSPTYEVYQIHEDKIDSDLLKYALTCKRQIGIFATKTEGTLIERMAVKADVFELCEISVPPKKEEQKRIAETLNTARQEITLLKKLADQYRTQKRGLMQKLLIGKQEYDH